MWMCHVCVHILRCVSVRSWLIPHDLSVKKKRRKETRSQKKLSPFSSSVCSHVAGLKLFPVALWASYRCGNTRSLTHHPEKVYDFFCFKIIYSSKRKEKLLSLNLGLHRIIILVFPTAPFLLPVKNKNAKNRKKEKMMEERKKCSFHSCTCHWISCSIIIIITIILYSFAFVCEIARSSVCMCIFHFSKNFSVCKERKSEQVRKS